MFRDAIKEVRYHPGRVVATLIAIAISVGFMAAVSIFVTTQSDALGKQAALPTSKSDVAVTVSTPKQGVTAQKFVDAVKSVPGVAIAEENRISSTSLSSSEGSVYVSTYGVPSESFRWAKMVSGSWPTKTDEVAITQRTADKLKVKVGDKVEAGEGKVTVSGISDEPASLFFDSAYLAPSAFSSQAGMVSLLIRAADGTSPDSLIAPIKAKVSPLVDCPECSSGQDSTNLEVMTSEQEQSAAVKSISGDFDIMKYILWVFSGIAALVGMIIISNTFTILLAQRRRQIGLLRAVGASGSQVRRRFLAEACVLGLIGSLLGIALGFGVAAIGASFTKALYFGLSVPWTDLLVEVLIGIVLTVIAAMAPSLKATRVAPLEALQPVATSEDQKKSSLVRAIVCGLLFVGGLALALSALNAKVGDGASIASGPMARAVVGCLLVAMGILFGAPLFIPTVLRGLGALFGIFGPTPKLAATNAVRNPRRASATATALMLACGLIVTLQVATATAQKTVLEEVAHKFPVDLTVQKYDVGSMSGGEASTDGTSLSPAALTRLDALPNIAQRATFTGGPVMTEMDATDPAPFSLSKVVAMSADAQAFGNTLPTKVADDEVLTSTDTKKGTKVTLSGNGQKVTLTSVPSPGIEGDTGIVSDAMMKKLVAKPAPQMQWLKLTNPDDIGGVMTEVQRISRAIPGIYPGGSVAISFQIRQMLHYVLLVMTALLGAAVLIALIGVSNTLGLSVIERTRESALLRALGMQKASLRLMLLVEALMLALAGVIVGVLMGGFFGWLGVKAALRQAALSAPVAFGIDLPLTLGLIAVAVVSAALASILPGRRAANATPTQALAE